MAKRPRPELLSQPATQLEFSRLEGPSDSKETVVGMIGFDFEDPKWWRLGWIPFLSNGGGEHLWAGFDRRGWGCSRSTPRFYLDCEKRAVKYPSFEACLTALVESMENGTLELS